jgi:SAM-dependent methyltransferase
VSRRALFSLGAARLIPDREDLGALGAAWRSYREAEAGVERTDFAALAELARVTWSEGEYGETAARLAPAAEALVEEAGVEPGQSVLDVGAGDGNVALAAAARGARVTAVDLSPRLVQQGRARCERAGAQVTWTVGDVERLPFGDGEFDCVLSGFGAMFAPRPRVATAELARVAGEGGPIALATWPSSGFMGGVLDLACRLAPLPADVPRPSRWGRFESAFLWLGSVVEDFEMTSHPLPLEFPSAAAVWEWVSAPPGPLAAALAEAGPGQGEEARASVLALVDAFGEPSGGSGVRVAAGYSVVTGRAAPRPYGGDAPPAAD